VAEIGPLSILQVRLGVLDARGREGKWRRLVWIVSILIVVRHLADSAPPSSIVACLDLQIQAYEVSQLTGERDEGLN
jgi:hypothetical protein